MKTLITFVLLLCWKISALAAFPALEYSIPFDLGGYTYTDYVILKIENSSAYDYAVVYYANHQSAYSTSECNKDLNCTQSACYGAFGYASYPDNRGTSGYLLQYNDWCGYIPHFSRKHNKTTGVWSDSGFENQSENLRVDPTIPLAQSTITMFPLSIFNYHPANDDFLGDYGLDVVTFGTVVLEANALGDVPQQFLRFPIANTTAYNADISTVFDHSGTAQYETNADGRVTAFNGETSNQGPYTGSTCYGNPNATFGSGFTYVGTSATDGNHYLCYDGHLGIDISVSYVNVYAAAAGIVRVASSDSNSTTCSGTRIEIEHGNGYVTKYFHLSSIDTNNVQVDQPIQKGEQLGISGNTGYCSNGPHLHFQIEKNNIPVDPYGWTGTVADPYTRAVNRLLWE